MKNRIFAVIFLSVCILFVPLVAQQVTDAQKAEIEKILTEAHKEIVDGWNQLNGERFMKYISEDFQERVANGDIGPVGREGLNKLSEAFNKGRKSQKYIQDYLKVFVISPDSAYVIQAGGLSYVSQIDRHFGFTLATTFIWKKEQTGWKIIYIHDSRM